MNLFRRFGSFAVVAVASVVSAAEAPVATPGAKPAVITSNCFADVVRISALVSLGDKVKVGIVDLATTNSYFVQAGEKAGPVDVVAIDYDKEQVTLRRGNTTCTLSLAADPNAPKIAPVTYPPDSPLYRGEAIERFIRENPKAAEQGMIKIPLPVGTPVAGHGETIDKYLSQNPEAARLANTPAVGKGEGIEKFLREHPEMKVDDTPIPAGNLGPGIEAAMKRQALIQSNGIPGGIPRPLSPVPAPAPQNP